MSSDPWREKYRKALLAQEQLEQRLADEQAKAQKMAISLTQLAEGKDKALDERLKAIRVCARNGDGAGMERMMGGLARISEEAASRSASHWKKTAEALQGLMKTLAKQTNNTQLKSALKKWRSRVGKQPLPPGLMAEQLGELAQLQLDVFNESPSEGLFSKWFGKKESGESNNEPQVEAEGVTEDADDFETVDQPVAMSHRRDPEVLAPDNLFKELSPQIARIVKELIAHFEPPVACIEQKIIHTRERLEKGLTWQELIPTLEDVRDLVMQAYLVADNDYRGYLEALDRELVKICEALGVAVNCEQQRQAAANSLQESMHTEIRGLNQALEQHDQVHSLKQSVSERIHHIEEALATFKAAQEEVSLSVQLNQLVEQVKKMEVDAQSAQHQLAEEKQRAITDPLTSLPNRQAYQERVFMEYSRWQRYQHPLTLAVVDIDHFKRINDTYGHQAGDRVLQAVSKSIAKRLREVDFIARFGGEEFVMIFPETDAKTTLEVLDQIRLAISKVPFTFKEEPVSITASFGIAQFEENSTIDGVFEQADQALYDAKASGRNQCRIAGVKPIT